MSTNEKNDLNIYLDEIDPHQRKNFVFIDVREGIELEHNPVVSIESIHLPFSQFGSWDFQFEPSKKYLLFCGHGMRSFACVERLRAKGIPNVQSIDDSAEAVQKHFSSV